MIKDIREKIKVDASVSIKPTSLRKIPELVINNTYYISFGSHVAHPCTLIEIINEFKETEVRVELELKKPRKRTYDIHGNLTDRPTQTNILYAREIGATPKQAVENTIG